MKITVVHHHLRDNIIYVWFTFSKQLTKSQIQVKVDMFFFLTFSFSRIEIHHLMPGLWFWNIFFMFVPPNLGEMILPIWLAHIFYRWVAKKLPTRWNCSFLRKWHWKTIDGCFKYFICSTRTLGKMNQFWRAYFFNWAMNIGGYTIQLYRDHNKPL